MSQFLAIFLVVLLCLGKQSVSYRFQFTPLTSSRSLLRQKAVEGSIKDKVALKLFLGNLPFKVEENEIRDHVSNQLGDGMLKSLSIPRGKKSKKGMGFAFVELTDSSQEAAQEAVKKLDGSDFNGRILNSNLKEVVGDPAENSRKKKVKRVVENSVFISNLDLCLTKEDLVEMCDDMLGEGLVASVEVPTDRETGSPRGFAYIEFKAQKTVATALAELEGLSVLDRVLACVPLNPPATPARIPPPVEL